MGVVKLVVIEKGVVMLGLMKWVVLTVYDLGSRVGSLTSLPYYPTQVKVRVSSMYDSVRWGSGR